MPLVEPEPITRDLVWADWLNLHNSEFSDIQYKIRERRKMYKLEWTPDEDTRMQKRWQDYIVDPLPRNDVDFKADRLTMRPVQVRIPTEQLTIDTVDMLNNNNGFQGLNLGSGMDMNQMIKRMKDVGNEIAQKRADSIE